MAVVMSDQGEAGAAPLPQPVRLLIADDHALFRRGLRDVLEEEADMRVVAEAADGNEAVRRAQDLWPSHLDLVLMDVDMPRLDGVAAARQIMRELPGLPVVMLTVSTHDQDAVRSIDAGAVGFLSKSLVPAALIRALRDFRRDGALPMAPTMAARVLSYYQRRAMDGDDGVSRPDRRRTDPTALQTRLTDREREVLLLVAQGSRDHEIARGLMLTESTVKSHVQNILRKLGARNRAEAVARFRGL